MSAHPLDGRNLARQIEAELAPRVEQLKETFHCPCLAVVVVGDDEPRLRAKQGPRLRTHGDRFL